MAKNLVNARKWAESVRRCVFKCKKWSRHQRDGLEKVHFDLINELLSANPLPCNEPRHIKLKVAFSGEWFHFLPCDYVA